MCRKNSVRICSRRNLFGLLSYLSLSSEILPRKCTHLYWLFDEVSLANALAWNHRRVGTICTLASLYAGSNPFILRRILDPTELAQAARAYCPNRQIQERNHKVLSNLNVFNFRGHAKFKSDKAPGCGKARLDKYFLLIAFLARTTRKNVGKPAHPTLKPSRPEFGPSQGSGDG